MTRSVSLSQIKGTGAPLGDGRPKEGSVLRQAYDALRRGERVHPSHYGPSHNLIRPLRDDYGMELRTKMGPEGYVELIGEWEGSEFVPLEKILQDDMA